MKPIPGRPDPINASSASGTSVLDDQPTPSHLAIDKITISRWRHSGPYKQVLGEGEFVLGVALSATHVRLYCGRIAVFEGAMRRGMTYVCGPARTFRVEFGGPPDILHLHLTGPTICPHMGASLSDTGIPGGPCLIGATPTMLPRDTLVEALARALLLVRDGADETYREALARAIALRAAQIEPAGPRVYPLAKPRLRQVIAHIEANLASPISLNELAAVAGLSRTHFAAQFRLATGCRPREFVLLQRVEAAKRMLADPSVEIIEVALTVGFQAQAHFSTVFKRFVGETPGRWRRTELRSPAGEPGEPVDGTRVKSEQGRSVPEYAEA